MNYIFGIGGMFLGFIITYIWMKPKFNATQTNLENKNELLQKAEIQLTDLQKSISEKLNETNRLLIENSSLRTQIDMIMAQSRKETAENRERFEAQLNTIKTELETASNALLKQRENELSKSNSEQMEAIVKPLRETIVDMKQSMLENIKTHVESKTSLEKAISELMQRTAEIGNDANQLARALKNESKTQGNWGELILENILEKSGLKEGIHYIKQVALRDENGKAILHDETGQRLIPDVVIHYPDNKDVIIDAKVSLSAFADYCNSDDDATKQAALQRHIESVRNHVKELKQKNYSNYIKSPRKALDYMIMFVPNESAMQLALYHDSTLWRDAFDKNIFITSEQNLLALLRMIQLAWSQVQQTKNQQEIFNAAQKILDRVSDFIGKYEEIGKKLEALNSIYEDTQKKLYTGNQSVVKAANQLVEMGAKTGIGKNLPEA